MKKKAKSFLDKFTCDYCFRVRQLVRFTSSAGKMVLSYCPTCAKKSLVLAGKP